MDGLLEDEVHVLRHHHCMDGHLKDVVGLRMDGQTKSLVSRLDGFRRQTAEADRHTDDHLGIVGL